MIDGSPRRDAHSEIELSSAKRMKGRTERREEQRAIHFLHIS
jgi:hypothetical protein